MLLSTATFSFLDAPFLQQRCFWGGLLLFCCSLRFWLIPHNKARLLDMSHTDLYSDAMDMVHTLSDGDTHVCIL